MAHELEIVDGKACMAYAGKVPWHGLGTPVADNLTPQEIMEAAGLDWEVEIQDTYFESKKNPGDFYPSGAGVLIRSTDEKVLCEKVSRDWVPCQNAQAFDFFTEFVESQAMKMETAGSLKGGSIVWALAKMNENFELFGGDHVKAHLLFYNPHQYGKKIGVKFCAERVVCHNTIQVALKENATTFTQSHARAFDPEAAKKVLGLATDKLTKFKEAAKFLGSKRLVKEDAVEYFSELFPTAGKKDTSRAVKELEKLLETQPGAEYAPGTWWQALNAVTYYTNHVKGQSDENRLYNQWFAPGKNKNVEALEKALEFASKS